MASPHLKLTAVGDRRLMPLVLFSTNPSESVSRMWSSWGRETVILVTERQAGIQYHRHLMLLPGVGSVMVRASTFSWQDDLTRDSRVTFREYTRYEPLFESLWDWMESTSAIQF